jgi:hypothetical protein
MQTTQVVEFIALCASQEVPDTVQDLLANREIGVATPQETKCLATRI